MNRLSVGIDLVEIHRIEQLIENWGDHFKSRCFTVKEIEQSKQKPHSLAGIFSAKEAFSKALGTGIRGFNLKDIEVLKDDLGKPFLNLDYSIEAFKNLSSCEISLSITHSKTYASAVVVIINRDLL